MTPRLLFSPTCKRSHWLLGYLRMSECEESGNQLTREFAPKEYALYFKRLKVGYVKLTSVVLWVMYL